VEEDGNFVAGLASHLGCYREWGLHLARLSLLELEIKHKHGGFNINYERATVVWQQSGSGS
jgi:hypothetical protein